VPLGLHEAGSEADAVGGAVDKNYMAVIDVDGMYNKSGKRAPQKRFPAMYPFSATVPELGFALLKVRTCLTSRVCQK
jgi:hypothetical protein